MQKLNLEKQHRSMRTHSQLKADEEFHGDEDNNDHKNDEKMKKKILQNPSSCFLATLSLN